MQVKRIIATGLAILTLGSGLALPAAAKCRKNYTADCTRAPFSWKVSFNDHPSGCTLCDHYVAERTAVYDHEVKVWNDENGKSAESKKLCGATAKASVGCGLKTKNRYLTFRIRVYSSRCGKNGMSQAYGDNGRRNVPVYF